MCPSIYLVNHPCVRLINGYLFFKGLIIIFSFSTIIYYQIGPRASYLYHCFSLDLTVSLLRLVCTHNLPVSASRIVEIIGTYHCESLSERKGRQGGREGGKRKKKASQNKQNKIVESVRNYQTIAIEAIYHEHNYIFFHLFLSHIKCGGWYFLFHSSLTDIPRQAKQSWFCGLQQLKAAKAGQL